MKTLSGLRVIEMGQVVLGPYAALLLADLGAEVVKVESIEGDSTRNLGHAEHPGMASVFLNCNRGKQSIAIDVKRPEGLEVVRKLVAGADIFLHNMRLDSATRLGIGYDELRELNPELIYCATYGYGASGRDATRPAFDDIIQAATGVPAIRQRIDGVPTYAPTILADKTTALFAVIGIVAAVAERSRTGLGRQIEVAMFETMSHFMSIEHLNGLTWEEPRGPSIYPRLLSASRRPHRTKDGYLAVMPHGEKQWRRFFTLLGRGEVLADPRFSDPASRSANIALLYDLIAEILPTKTNAEWTRIFTDGDVPFGPVNRLEDLIEDPHLKDVGFWHEIEHPTEGRLRAPSFPIRDGGPNGTLDATTLPAPRLGEHSVAILRSLGYETSTITALLTDGVIGSTPEVVAALTSTPSRHSFT